MAADSWGMALTALGILADPLRLLFLSAGVLMGLVLGIIPGIGGLLGLSILLPFTFDMDPYTAFAMMLGLSAVTVTSDTIPAVLFSVPGTVGSAATILDGFPMARKGQAGRALGAAFFASVLGGLFGALMLGVSVPVLKPLVLLIRSPELLAISIFGMSMVAFLSGSSPLKGLAAACLGLLVATTGEDPQTATLRFTFDTFYLWDGLPIVPLALGLFALPEMADLAIARRAISGEYGVGTRWSQLEGIRDVGRSWWLVIRCASIGSFLGAVPGMGASVIDWIAYGHAARTEKGASETFGTGDVRGVIASESSNNAKEGGALIPTIAFGVPGSASMALLLGAFLIHGLVPGPDMLSKNLDLTYVLVWSIALANILGAGICFAFANQLSRIASIRIGLLAPIVVSIAFVGAFQGSKHYGDLIAVLSFGLLGWIMKRLGWPRPPLILGFVLGPLVERYLFRSIDIYGWGWLTFPIVIGILAVTVVSLLRPILSGLRRLRGATRVKLHWPRLDAEAVFTLLVAVLFAASLFASARWPAGAALAPEFIAWAGLIFSGSLFASYFVLSREGRPEAAPAQRVDTTEDFGDLPTAVVLRRAATFLLWCLLYFAATMLIGLLPAMAVFLVGYIRLHSREKWRTAATVAVPLLIFSYVLFHQIVAVAWPRSLLGDLLPAIRGVAALNFI